MTRARRTLVAAVTILVLWAAAQLGLPVLLGGTAMADVPVVSSPGATPLNLTDPHFVRLQIDAVSPGMITSSSSSTLAVHGMVVNDGDRNVRNLQVRLQRGPVITSPATLRTALRTSPTELSTQAPFVTVAASLNPGESAPFALYLPLTGNENTSLALSEPGVYPLLVNVNGQPDFGDRARLDEGHFLLPVLSLPAENLPTGSLPAEQSTGDGAAPIPEPPPTGAAGITVVWPLAERPLLLPSPRGAPALLSDDELARSFADGGRLDGLLKSVEEHATDPNGALAKSLCLAIDPDLLVTAQAMTAGYEVAGIGGEAVTAGTGAAVARTWLDRLRAVSKQRCVVALPWGQADLNALSRASLTDLESTAVISGADVVAKALALPTLPSVTWPNGGMLADRTASDLRTLGQKAVLVSSDGVTTASGAALPPAVQTAQIPAGGGSLSAALIDAASAGALAAMGPGDKRQLRVQDALGAVAWPAISASGTTSTPAASAPGSLLVAPPQVWDVTAEEAGAVLSEADALLKSGVARAQPLTATLDAAAASTARPVLSYPVQATADEVPVSTTAKIAQLAVAIQDFATALKVDPQSGVSPNDLLAPLQLALLRGVAAQPSTAAAQDRVRDAPQIDAVRVELSRLHEGVFLQAPGGTYTLASANSPLLLVVRNDLPVTVSVRVSVDAPPGLRATDIGVQELPANSGRQLQLPTTVSRTGQFAVDVSLTTASGQQLGDPARLQVRSTAYGSATALATAGAALLLLLLVARRLWHRFRGEPDRADEVRADQ